MSRVLSGVTPSSSPHLGNYLGAFRQWVDGQGEAETFFFISDLHAITLEHDPEQLRARTIGLATTLLAVGIDPSLTTIWLQSHIPEHSQMTWLLQCTASFGELRRMTQFKDKSGDNESVRVGLFTYPTLMAADILLYDIEDIPVGEDQRQHVELTRDVAIRFNTRYGDTFVVPQATIPATGARIKDLQEPTKKMSKSIGGGAVWLTDNPADIEKKFKRAVTDTDGEVRYDPDAKPGVSNLLEILGATTRQNPASLADNYTQYGPLKSDTAAAVIELLAPIQARYRELEADPGSVLSILAQGAERAGNIAAVTLERAQRNMGFVPAHRRH